MNQNVGETDFWVRTLMGIMMIAAGAYMWLIMGDKTGLFGLVGIIPVLTAGIHWCPFYAMFGINSCGIHANKNNKED